MARFFYPVAQGGVLTCDGKKAQGSGTNKDQPPFDCPFFNGELVISLAKWGWEGTATLALTDAGQKQATITGFCSGSVTPDQNAPNSYQYQLNPSCLPNDEPPPAATGERLVDEWYTDLPWHQKLSTLDSNLIDVPFVLPYEALPKKYRVKCKKANEDPARCMLDYGIVDVMGIHRTDTVYKAGEALTQADCQGKQCVEVKLAIQRFHTQTDDPSGYEPDPMRNDRVWIKDGKVKHTPEKGAIQIPSLGFGLTEATIFAPWRNWYTGHYCTKIKNNITTSVCYEDYFTTGLIAPTPENRNWLKDRPALFWPRGTKTGFESFCKAEEDCFMYLGKVDWLKAEDLPSVETGHCWKDPAAKKDPLDDSVCNNQLMEDTADLDTWFGTALEQFEDKGRYPWNYPELEKLVPPSADCLWEQECNPFIGFYALQSSEIIDQDLTPRIADYNFKYDSPHYVLPKKCTPGDYRLARAGDLDSISRLSDCAVDFEIHTSGFFEIWKDLYDDHGTLPLSDSAILDINKAIGGLAANQYGRTMFLYAGVREQHVAVSFDTLGDGMSIHDKVYSGGPYVQFLPLVNPGDRTLLWFKDNDPGKNYQDNFWHAFFMSNHMNQDPDHFIRGLRGRTLWHNEYRSNMLYTAWKEGKDGGTKFAGKLGHVDFPAGFQTGKPLSAPFHGNTCDACHVRNGSGIPLMPNGKLPLLHFDDDGNPLMKADYHVRAGANKGDYTYTNIAYPDKNDPNKGQEVPSMKMVFFDLREPPPTDGSGCDDDNNTVPAKIDLVPLAPAASYRNRLYSNKIMNFYGNSLQLNQNDNRLSYEMHYEPISGNDGFEVVDGTPRKRRAVGDVQESTYKPKRIKIDTSQILADDVCLTLRAKPDDVPSEVWPSRCDDVSGKEIHKAIDDGNIGVMHLLGRRLGNTPLIEMIPDAEILAARAQQSVSGCLSLAPGTRRGTGTADYHYQKCTNGKIAPKPGDADYSPNADYSNYCYIGRWGWIGDRASLEDQIANAAHVEMNITSSESYYQIHPNPNDAKQLVRYKETLCGPANQTCQDLSANSDISEQEIRDMATYQRWIGIPNRSEYQVASKKVHEGEQIFKDLQCDSCHVIKKIAFDSSDNMLPDEEREHLKKLEIKGEDGKVEYPFVAYLGTDLQMHDMGYLSQVAPVSKEAVENGDFREKKSGKVQPRYRDYVQYIRTPALKGLRFNRFVTDSNHNTQDATVPLGKNDPDGHNFTPGCDFLLHDGRACDAIEAAYLHDGPAVKALHMIENLNALKDGKLDQLRAFLYSL